MKGCMIYILLTASLAAADLITKALARRDAHIKKIYNPGFSFGFLKEHPFIVKGIPTSVGILSAVQWARCVAAAEAAKKAQNRSMRIASVLKGIAHSMILAGAIGNTYERVARGYVTDFINVPKGRIRTWFFNIADMCVAAGAAIMLLGELTEDKRI